GIDVVPSVRHGIIGRNPDRETRTPAVAPRRGSCLGVKHSGAVGLFSPPLRPVEPVQQPGAVTGKYPVFWLDHCVATEAKRMLRRRYAQGGVLEQSRYGRGISGQGHTDERNNPGCDKSKHASHAVMSAGHRAQFSFTSIYLLLLRQ